MKINSASFETVTDLFVAFVSLAGWETQLGDQAFQTLTSTKRSQIVPV